MAGLIDSTTLILRTIEQLNSRAIAEYEDVRNVEYAKGEFCLTDFL